MDRKKIWTIRAVAVALGVLATLGVMRLATARPVENWQPFSLAALDQGLAAGRPVVVDWTASWCLNCRAVEATVLQSASVQDAFKRADALLLKADITNDNPPAEEMLSALGARAIPVLAIYSPQHPRQPHVLRDIYTRNNVIDALSQAKSSETRP